MSSICEFRQKVCAMAKSQSQVLLFLSICFGFYLEFLLLQSTATFSFISVLSLSLHLSSKFLSMALHFYASCSFTNIFHTAPERAVSSTSIMSTYSLPFSLSDAFLLHGHFLIHSGFLAVLLEYKCISLLALFVSHFHVVQGFPCLGPDSVIHITHLLSSSPSNYASLGTEL